MASALNDDLNIVENTIVGPNVLSMTIQDPQDSLYRFIKRYIVVCKEDFPQLTTDPYVACWCIDEATKLPKPANLEAGIYRCKKRIDDQGRVNKCGFTLSRLCFNHCRNERLFKTRCLTWPVHVKCLTSELVFQNNTRYAQSYGTLYYRCGNLKCKNESNKAFALGIEDSQVRDNFIFENYFSATNKLQSMIGISDSGNKRGNNALGGPKNKIQIVSEPDETLIDFQQ